MSVYDRAKAAAFLLDSMSKDIRLFEMNGSRAGYGGYYGCRPGASKEGIKNSAKMIRRMMLEIMKEVEG